MIIQVMRDGQYYRRQVEYSGSEESLRRAAFRHVYGRKEKDYTELLHRTEVIDAEVIDKMLAKFLLETMQ